VHAEHGTIEFMKDGSGLHACVFSDECKKHVEEEKKKMKQEQQHTMAQEEKMPCCAPAQAKAAREARTLCHNVSPQTVENFKAIMRGNMIKNCPAAVKDAEMAEDMFGPDVSHSKSASTRSSPRPAKHDEIAVPKEIHQKLKEIAFHVDAMHVNGLPFLASAGCPICSRGCKSMDNTAHDEHRETLDRAFGTCNQAGFGIKTMQCDGEHRGVMDKASDGLDVKMSCTNAQEHESRSERNNQMLKEAFGAALQQTGCQRMPVVVIRELAEPVAERMNMFPAEQGASEHCSPNAIVNKQPLDCRKHCQHSFGAHAQANAHDEPTNAPAERT